MKDGAPGKAKKSFNKMEKILWENYSHHINYRLHLVYDSLTDNDLT